MNWIEQGWYNDAKRNYLLLPLCGLFYLLSNLRRGLFKYGWLKAQSADKPVIVVGNIGVGGNGKTPFVIWLVQQLQQQGIKAGVISRGYGGHSEVYPLAVNESFDTGIFGDEPVLIAKRTGVPVVVGSNRIDNCRLLSQQFDIDVIISDDGMQHYQLQRDIEIAIVDAQRQFGNGWLMPVGPLRETIKRLDTVDYVIYNGLPKQPDYQPDGHFELALTQPVQLIPGHHNMTENIHGVCAIGNGQRFKNTLTDFLRQQGKSLTSFKAWPDHHQFKASDFEQYGQESVFMTEKDAVKCYPFAQANWSYLPVDAKFEPDFTNRILTHIKQVIRHGI